MHAIIDLNSELLIDRSRVRDPHIRLLLAALGRELVRGSAWVAVSKEIATHYGLAHLFAVVQGRATAA
jgi:hypothetical protein